MQIEIKLKIGDCAWFVRGHGVHSGTVQKIDIKIWQPNPETIKTQTDVTYHICIPLDKKETQQVSMDERWVFGSKKELLESL